MHGREDERRATKLDTAMRSASAGSIKKLDEGQQSEEK
jgi:hypothetical protein